MSEQRVFTREELRSLDLLALAREGTVHFVGIAGAGMSAIAEMVLRHGGSVTGCDTNPAPVESLRKLGAKLFTGQDPAHVETADAVVTTAAVRQDHPELVAARARGIPVLKRAQALGALVNRGIVVAVAGTHGKTTTTAMATAILVEAGLDPTGFVGGRVAGWNSGLRAGGNRVYVVEADEYDRSFLMLEPTAAVVTAIEADHLDVYGTLQGVEEAFRDFLAPVPATGIVAVCSDDLGARALLRDTRSARTVSYGTGPEAMLRAVDIRQDGPGMSFTVTAVGQALGEIRLRVPGLHNVRNALGAFAAARHVGAEFEHARRALNAFSGVSRRFQILGQARGIVVVDDYAHHPTEIDATISAARAAYPAQRIVAVFQPHLFSRTRDFASDFGRALAGADIVWLTDIYAAREQPIEGVTGQMIADAVQSAGGAKLHYVPELDALGVQVGSSLEQGDICVVMGAGNIDDVARTVYARLMEVG
jgi:UDP-N-acetylmuramate--alanine ligase